MEICAGLARPTAGSLSWYGEELGGLDGRELERWRVATVGYLDQESSMLADLRVIENILVGVRRASSADVGRSMDLMRSLGIDHLARAWPDRCSGGERQRAALVRTLVREPDLVVVDEPTASLDADSARQALAALDAARARGASILVATHDDLVVKWADNAIHL